MAWILLTNDDGIEAESLQTLVTALHERGHGCIVFAPSENNSAVSMKISLGKPLTVTKIEDDRDRMHQFSIGGTPCDCIIAALDGGLQKLVPGIMPKLVVSGVNLGPNLSQDAYHSGTIAAAREAGMYGNACNCLIMVFIRPRRNGNCNRSNSTTCGGSTRSTSR